MTMSMQRDLWHLRKVCDNGPNPKGTRGTWQRMNLTQWDQKRCMTLSTTVPPLRTWWELVYLKGCLLLERELQKPGVPSPSTPCISSNKRVKPQKRCSVQGTEFTEINVQHFHEVGAKNRTWVIIEWKVYCSAHVYGAWGSYPMTSAFSLNLSSHESRFGYFTVKCCWNPSHSFYPLARSRGLLVGLELYYKTC